MRKLIAQSVDRFISIFAWILVIVLTLTGFVGAFVAMQYSDLNLVAKLLLALVGAVLGFVVAILLCVLLLGVVTLLSEIRSSNEAIRKELKEMKTLLAQANEYKKPDLTSS